MTDEPQNQDTPPKRERVTKGLKDRVEANREMGKVLKVLYLDEKGDPVGEYASSAKPESEFEGLNVKGIQQPPISLEQLVYLAELHPVHSAALEQKTADVLGKGWEWTAEDDDAADPDLRDEMDAWFKGLAPDDMDMRELLHAVWLDLETTGWGLLEVVRDPSGIAKKVYHVPAHTCRAHKDGFRLVQIRERNEVWFRRWGAPPRANGKKVEVDAKTGNISRVKDPANDMLVLKRPSRRSTWYGIPGYVSAIGWITLALAARDDNLFFFQNRREPRWAIVLTDLAPGDDVEEMLRRAFTIDLKQPHRNIIVPIEGPGKVTFQKLSDNQQEGSFEKLSERADRAIAIAHRVPGERIANASIGVLGGNSVSESSRIYKEGVVSPGQEFLASRLNRFIQTEYPIFTGNPADAEVEWLLTMDDLDLGTDAEELDQAVNEFKSDLCTLREARAKIKRGPLMMKNEAGEEEESPYNDMLYTELPGVSSYDDVQEAPADPAMQAAARNADELTKQVAQLIDSGRQVESAMHTLLAAQE